jgi:small-conductance mechanosensitive channel
MGALFAWTAIRAGSLFFGMFEPDTLNSNVQLRDFLGYQEQEIIPGLWMGRLLLLLAILGGFIFWLLIIWNVPHSDINALGAYFTQGFPVGAVTIVPSKIITAVLAFFLLLTLARWLRNQLSERWLQKTRLDAGARESIVSLTTYAIVGIALVMALGMAGVDFQNVAIVAGALSVGIGFGLQNIVNNFVSGLILLFERPVKPGDWIVVGATEGYVRKISIRYTLIQTFDRADVLVPNSELISSQVTNWMLRDSMGRVIVPVGVAYGSDTKLVREVLYQIAANHSLVLVNDWKVSPPKVLFMGFGDSSLNFEVRCFIKDIDYRMSVRSDLLFAIDEEFRKAGIEIPFPQRVLHMSETASKTAEDPAMDSNNTPRE